MFENSVSSFVRFFRECKWLHYIIATVRRPVWKLRWIPNDLVEDRRNYIKEIALKASEKIAAPDKQN